MTTKGSQSFREHLELSHTPGAIHDRLEQGPKHNYLGDFLYGAIDGTVTTFAVVTSVAGAGLSSSVIIVLGLANLLADGLSMAASNFVGTRAEEQLRQRAREEEQRHIEIFPQGEREEIRQIFKRKGFEGEDLERAVEVITADVNRWVDTMLQEELGIALEGPSPIRAAMTTFVAFALIGFIPLGAYVWNLRAETPVSNPLLWSTILTGAAFFIIGAAKSRFVSQRWYVSGLETLAVGGVAASVAYAVGMALRGVVSGG